MSAIAVFDAEKFKRATLSPDEVLSVDLYRAGHVAHSRGNPERLNRRAAIGDRAVGSRFRMRSH